MLNYTTHTQLPCRICLALIHMMILITVMIIKKFQLPLFVLKQQQFWELAVTFGLFPNENVTVGGDSKTCDHRILATVLPSWSAPSAPSHVLGVNS